MIIKIINDRNRLFWLSVHLVLGVGCSVYPFLVTLYIYSILFFSLNRIISNLTIEKSSVYLLPLVLYIGSFEIFARMNQASPYIPWELSKYLFLSLVLFVIVNPTSFKEKSLLVPSLFILLLPGVFLDFNIEISFDQIIFNVFGLFSLLSLLFLIEGINFQEKDFNSLLRLIWYPSLSMLVFIIIKTPDYSDLKFTLDAQFSTSGGFGSNQVATSLGVGMFLSFYAWMNKLKFSGYHSLDGVFIGLFAYQGFMTFSRGGMVIGILAIFIYFFMFRRANDYLFSINLKSLRPFYFFFTAVTIIIISYFLIEALSSGNISHRYLGETATTLSGEKLKTINTITTGRYNIMISDLKLWEKNFIFGTGVGGSKILRGNETNGIASHNEFSRLLAEHGLFGFLFIIMLFSSFLHKYLTNSKNIYSSILIAMFFIGVGSMLHSGMRTFIPSIFISLSFLRIQNNL